MSANLCSDCLITALSAYALRHGLAGRLVDYDSKNDPIVALGEMLKRENAASIRERYSGATVASDWPAIDAPFVRCLHGPSMYSPAFDDPMAIAKAALYFQHQTCDHRGWDRDNIIRDLVEAIASHAFRQTFEYQAKPWGYECKHPTDIAKEPTCP
jgi:hypothetical protein